MAKIVEQVVAIKFSKLVKTHEDQEPELVNADILGALEQVVQELVNDSVVVELEILEWVKLQH